MTPTPEQLANRIKWVEALRSGKYHQGTVYLCRIVGCSRFYCAIGVGCAALDIPGEPLLGGIIRFGDSTSLTPTSFIERTGVNGTKTCVAYNGEEVTIAFLNDRLKLPFSEIAGIIEEQLIKPYES